VDCKRESQEAKRLVRMVPSKTDDGLEVRQWQRSEKESLTKCVEKTRTKLSGH
jgi:hypothetical protein